MKLITKDIEQKLLANGRNRGQDHPPVVKIFNPIGSATWLLSEIDPEAPDIAFGLADLGMGCPELGSVSLSQLQNFHNNLTGLGLERDLFFEASAPMSAYVAAAARAGYIVEHLS
ncbi:single-stranded DNA endonuclease [Iodidimonas gelatinilytica]|uniref:Single-stranded DNA endonuclease n=1 Tax=Iodidimonas gelatinilytica TaxID=1236966 RepID=A0A5A7MVB3_9PROT|nr:DUF2958 domain-containing protein [Iodidimonas gelatinilytica]GEQ99273.1 single-stranded DNA endonuclease [Iodidimonas gelatinilytica]